MVHFKLYCIKKLLLFYCIACITCFSTSCSGNQAPHSEKKVTQNSEAYDTSFVKGQLLDTTVCLSQPNQSYALFLPSNYNPQTAWPVIYFFDAHARGSMPLRMYQALAEKYGFVFVGSNVSKNGMPWETARAHVNELMHDVNTRIHIDPQRVYTAGFSGGSRVASSVAIFEGGVAGVIGCAAGFPKIESGITSKFDYVGLVGLYDFNLNEMIQLDQTLDQNTFTHQLIRFNDKHGWADTTSFETALLWLQVNAMKENKQVKNDACVNALKHQFDQQIKFRSSTSEWLLVNELLEGAIRVLESIADISTYQKQLNVLHQNPNYKKAVDLQQRLQDEELKQQQFFVQQFAQHDVAWWTNTITQMNVKIKHAQSKAEAQMNQRLLNYLGFIAYMNSNHSLQINDLNSANTFLSIFKLADPKNPDVAYLRAIYSIKKMVPVQAIGFLKESAALGYSDLPQLLSEPLFAEILSNADFRMVMQKVQLNALNKKE